MIRKLSIFAALACLLSCTTALGEEASKSIEAVEVGDRWKHQDWESAKAAATKSKKPILALFR